MRKKTCGRNQSIFSLTIYSRKYFHAANFPNFLQIGGFTRAEEGGGLVEEAEGFGGAPGAAGDWGRASGGGGRYFELDADLSDLI